MLFPLEIHEFRVQYPLSPYNNFFHSALPTNFLSIPHASHYLPCIRLTHHMLYTNLPCSFHTSYMQLPYPFTIIPKENLPIASPSAPLSTNPSETRPTQMHHNISPAPTFLRNIFLLSSSVLASFRSAVSAPSKSSYTTSLSRSQPDTTHNNQIHLHTHIKQQHSGPIGGWREGGALSTWVRGNFHLFTVKFSTMMSLVPPFSPFKDILLFLTSS